MTPFWALGQHGHIKKEVDEGVIIYKSASLEHIQAIKQITDMDTVYALYVYMKDDIAHFDDKGLFLTLENDTIYKDPDAKITCVQGTTVISSFAQPSFTESGKYYMWSTFMITTDQLKQLIHTRIRKIATDHISATISKKEALSVMEYLQALSQNDPIQNKT